MDDSILTRKFHSPYKITDIQAKFLNDLLLCNS